MAGGKAKKEKARPAGHTPYQGGISFHKSKGHHILKNPLLVDSIVQKSGIKSTDIILEIGPGIGNLTKKLLEAGKRLTAVEIDTHMVLELQLRGNEEGDRQRPIKVNHQDRRRRDRHLPDLTADLWDTLLKATATQTPTSLSLSVPQIRFGAKPLSNAAPAPMSQPAAEATPDIPKSDTTDVLVQYVVLRRDLIDTWPTGSVVTQGCHASVSAIWSHKGDPITLQYCSPENIDSMHKLFQLVTMAGAEHTPRKAVNGVEIDDIIIEQQLVLVVFQKAVNGVEVDPSAQTDYVEAGSKVEMPLWLAYELHLKQVVKMKVPACFNHITKLELGADGATIDLRS
ncbi:hypothetical protein TB2_005227 [Malus domestica]